MNSFGSLLLLFACVAVEVGFSSGLYIPPPPRIRKPTASAAPCPPGPMGDACRKRKRAQQEGSETDKDNAKTPQG